MSPQVRIADGLRTQSAERLITTAGAIIDGMTGNPSFPSPPVDLKAVQAAVDDLNAALAAQPNGGPPCNGREEKQTGGSDRAIAQAEALLDDRYGNDLPVLLSSGFQAAVTSRVRSPLANPSILNVRFGNSTELVLKVTPIAQGAIGSASQIMQLCTRFNVQSRDRKGADCLERALDLIIRLPEGD